MFILIILLFFLQSALATGDVVQNYRSLLFGKTVGDFLQFTPDDMSPFEGSFTICSWVKKLHDASHPMVLHYYLDHSQIILGDDGHYNWVKGRYLNLNGKYPPSGKWFHNCLSWAAGGELKVYVNGLEIGNTSASSENIPVGGTISLGINAVQKTKNPNHVFGGQLHKLNMYSEQLTSFQMKKMFEAGLCSSAEESYGSRRLKWENILSKPRNGNVREVHLTEVCIDSIIADLKAKLNRTETELRETNRKLEETQTTLNKTGSELQEVKKNLNVTVAELADTRTQLNATQTVLKRKEIRLERTERKLNNTELELQEVSADLNHTRSLLEKARRLETVSRWDVLYTPSYLNQIFTKQLYNQLTNSWTMMGNFNSWDV